MDGVRREFAGFSALPARSSRMRRLLPTVMLAIGCASAPSERDPIAAPPTPRPTREASIVTPDRIATSEPPSIAAANADADVDRAGILAEGAQGSGEVALTFDDGPSAENTPEALRVLAAHRVHGAFFLSAERLAGEGIVSEVHREHARAIFLSGHVVGNHALEHRALDACASDVGWCTAQIDGAARLVADATGVDPHWFRPPYGRMVPEAQRLLSLRGDELVLWTIDAQDTTETDADKIAHRLEQQLLFAGQGVVLLHDLRAPSVRALSLLLDWLELHPRDEQKKTGFVVVDLPTYFRDAAAHPYPYANRLQLLRAREQAHSGGAG
jgi:peptidoglycan/xylan/chitin deacetylase (PgdA/CDA1 family)